MKIRRSIASGMAVAVVAGLMLLGASPARADGNGFVCNVNHSPQGVNGGFGTYGYVFATLYTAPRCSGGFIGSYFFCSDGNNHPYCHTGAYHSWYNIPPLLQMLQSAANAGTRTTIYTGQCKLSGGTNCAVSANFSASP